MSESPGPEVLIHIGLPKAASSYLQQAAAQQSDIRLLRHGDLGIEAWARSQAEGGPVPDRLPPPDLAMRTFVSSEELIGFGDNAPRYQALCARALHEVFPKARILVITRQPASFADSFYNQLVKEGASEGPAVFARRWGDFIADVLDFRHVREVYESLFGVGSVLFMPVEQLRASPESFYHRIRQHGGIDLAPARPEAILANESLSPEELHGLRVLNKVVGLMMRGVEAPAHMQREALDRTKRQFLSYYLAGGAARRRSARVLRPLRLHARAPDILSRMTEAQRRRIAAGLEPLLAQREFEPMLELYGRGLPPAA